MRRSNLEHPVAILRQIIGLGQKELAALVSRSTSTIQAIEINKLPLSEELALRISHETGVSLAWLIKGDVEAPPVTEALEREAFTKEIYELTRAQILAGTDPLTTLYELQKSAALSPEEQKQVRDQLNRNRGRSIEALALKYDLAKILASVFAAQKAGRATLALYRIAEFVAAMREEFGQLVNEEFCRKANNPLFGAIARVAVAGAQLQNGKKGGFPQHRDGYVTDPWDSYNPLTPEEIEAFEFVITYKDAYEAKKRLKRTWFVDENGKWITTSEATPPPSPKPRAPRSRKAGVLPRNRDQ